MMFQEKIDYIFFFDIVLHFTFCVFELIIAFS